jgi:hypothetical protein
MIRIEAIEVAAYQARQHRAMDRGWGRRTGSQSPLPMTANNLPPLLDDGMRLRVSHEPAGFHSKRDHRGRFDRRLPFVVRA